MTEEQNNGHVLLVDDEEAIRDALGELLETCGYKTVTADCYTNAVKVLKENEAIETVICDLKMPGESGLEVLRYINKEQLEIPLVFLTGFGTLETCQEAVKEGAFDYILKPIDHKDKLLLPLKHAVEKRRLELKTKQMQLDIIRMAEEHQNILDNLLTDAEMKDRIQERIGKILEKWET